MLPLPRLCHLKTAAWRWAGSALRSPSSNMLESNQSDSFWQNFFFYLFWLLAAVVAIVDDKLVVLHFFVCFFFPWNCNKITAGCQKEDRVVHTCPYYVICCLQENNFERNTDWHVQRTGLVSSEAALSVRLPFRFLWLSCSNRAATSIYSKRSSSRCNAKRWWHPKNN